MALGDESPGRASTVEGAGDKLVWLGAARGIARGLPRRRGLARIRRRSRRGPRQDPGDRGSLASTTDVSRCASREPREDVFDSLPRDRACMLGDDDLELSFEHGHELGERGKDAPHAFDFG